ncbi:hypothetical protein BY996DRAFT_6425813 [Phakopsora pachyrhizi]|uniref:Expressed protein n=1 Tax=Phakopsora pachyrhizi TaxID=170000 RepID=A0AAV0BEK9_PHAPC|nr:hypothetical protein BY996DRAFT_6425813 [Phakopsora pachyrhizi]CAH7667961.1 expressed protein [Phakopsora pachyrhizi]CAH7685594.1 expressed protein [Phakopsora pachyrhizi]
MLNKLSFSVILPILFLYQNSIAQEGQKPRINSPTGITQCVPVTLNVGGGIPPYSLSILPGGQTNAAPLQTFPTIEKPGPITWNADLPSGTAITFQVRDSKGSLNYSGQTTITAGGNCTGISLIGAAPDAAVPAQGATTPSASNLPSLPTLQASTDGQNSQIPANTDTGAIAPVAGAPGITDSSGTANTSAEPVAPVTPATPATPAPLPPQASLPNSTPSTPPSPANNPGTQPKASDSKPPTSNITINNTGPKNSTGVGNSTGKAGGSKAPGKPGAKSDASSYIISTNVVKLSLLSGLLLI